MQKLPYRTALVTGASSGIGEAIARDLARHQVNLVILARSEDKLLALAEELRGHGISVDVLVKDLTSENAVRDIRNETTKRGLQIDLLINNAGFGAYGYFCEVPVQQFKAMIDLNIKALVELTHAYLPDMITANHGAIINVSSTAGFQAVPFMATYAATKAFVTSLTMAIATELRHTDLTFVALCPGRTRTNFQVASGSNKIRIKSRAATPQDVSRVAIDALHKRRLIAIEGWSNKSLMHLQRFFSRKTALRIAYQIFKPRSSPTGKSL